MEGLVSYSSSSESEPAGRCDLVKCVTVGVKEEKESGSLDLNLVDSGMVSLEDEIKSVDSGLVGLEDEIKSVDTIKIEVSDTCTLNKPGRKKKVAEGFEGIGGTVTKKVKVERDGVEVSGRLLRSRVKVDASVVGFKRRMEAECFDQADMLKGVDESSQLARRPQKKLKRRGRPAKVQGEAGVRNVKEESFDQVEIKKEVNERSKLVGRPKTKRKPLGRPPKMNGETGLKRKRKDDCFDQVDLQKEAEESSQVTSRQQKKFQIKNDNKDTLIKNLKARGRPMKSPAGDLLTNTDEPDNNQVQESENFNDNKRKVKSSEKSNDHTIVEETAEGDNKKQLNSNLKGNARVKKKQFLKDQIVSMIMKGGWTIEYRPRQGREYLDAVYVDPKGKTHWSITKAYFSLQTKIESGKADAKETSAFTPIPVEEMNLLLKAVSKIRSDKNMKKKKRGKKNKAEIVISNESQLKKMVNKKVKDGKKMDNKSSIVKVKKGKSESAVKKRSKVGEKGRQGRKPCLVARSSSKGLNQDDADSAIYTAKRNILSWMIDSGVITLGGKLLYGECSRNKSLEGEVTPDGIHCSCCDQIMDISHFASHGGGKLEQALKNIYNKSGETLLTCLLESWKKEVESTNIKFNQVDVQGDDPNDDTCNLCGDGGDLICCDGCPSTFHQSCLDIQNFPSGDWHCSYCCCKFCGLVSCDDLNHVAEPEMITCFLCEQKFHHSCSQDENKINVDSSSLLFCRKKCQELYEQLEAYVGVKVELKEGFSWTLLKSYNIGEDFDDQMKIECNSKSAVAYSVMDECFEPIIDEKSGINRIHNVVYSCGSNFKRLDYSGFFTAILEKGSELIAAASIRIHGNQLAEMPFIGTRHMYRRQGMCRRLLDAIEAALCSLGVDKLVIPAIPELYDTWTKVFGFKPLEESSRQTMKGMSLIVFPGTDMLYKPLLKNQFADTNISPVAGDKPWGCIAVENDDSILHSENKSSNPIDNGQTLDTHLETETFTTSLQKADDEHKSASAVNNDVASVKMSLLTSEVIAVENDDSTLHSEIKASNLLDNEQTLDTHLETETPTTSLQKADDEHKSATAVNNDVASVKMSLLTSEVIAVENDDSTLHSEIKASNPIDFEQTLDTHLETETPTTSVQKADDEHKSASAVNNDAASVKMSLLTSEVAPKNSFDLNEQPALTDADLQFADDESISREPQVGKNPLELSESVVHVDNTATQPLLLV